MRILSNLVLACLLTGGAVAVTRAQQPQPLQQTPVFRGGVDLVTVDVIVLDKGGKLVTDLTAKDFAVTAGKRARRIVAAEYVSAVASRPGSGVTTDEPAPQSTSNTRLPAGRSFIFAVDVEEIRAGEGRVALKGISDYLDQLSFDDRVGLVSLPYGTPRVDLTTNRKPIRDAAALIVGASNRIRDPQMTPGEAAGIAMHDIDALMAYYTRNNLSAPVSSTTVCGAVGSVIGPERPTEVPDACLPLAQAALTRYHTHTRVIYDGLAALADALAPIPGPKAIVLISEGLLNDAFMADDLAHFARAAERARVSLYALHLEAPLAEASGSTSSNTMQSRTVDDRLGFDGMSELAYAARGTALRVSGTPANALAQIDRELSGYYLVSFESDLEDRDGKREDIQVRVSRSGLDVRARKEFTPGPTPSADAVVAISASNLRSAMGELLRWPSAVTGIGVDVDTFAAPVDGSATDVRTMIAAELAANSRPIAAVGFEVLDESGKVVADTFDAQVAAQPLPDGRALYPVTVVVPPGRYRLKFGAIDADGRRGSVEHAFEVRGWTAGAVRMSDVILGAVENNKFRPIARLAPRTSALPVRLEIQADAPPAFAGVRMKLQIVRAGEAASLAEETVALTETNSPLKRSAFRALDIASLPAGDYLVRATLEGADGRAIATRTRRFVRTP